MTEATIEVAGLRKRFGPVLALDGMSFTVQPGQVTGFVGPNGAGKSTTMRVILGLAAADAGHALIGGRRYQSLDRPLRHVGSLLDAGAVQPSRTARNHLLWLAHSQGLRARRVDEVIEQAGLDRVARRRAGGYSLGMRQRLGSRRRCSATRPPSCWTSRSTAWTRRASCGCAACSAVLAQAGRAVLVSSHLISELQDTAGHLVVVGRGQVIADTSARELLRRRPGAGSLRTVAADRAAEALTRAGAAVTAAGPGMLAVSGLSPERAVGLLTGHAVPFSEVCAHRASLEEAYLELAGDAAEFRAEVGR